MVVLCTRRPSITLLHTPNTASSSVHVVPAQQLAPTVLPRSRYACACFRDGVVDVERGTGCGRLCGYYPTDTSLVPRASGTRSRTAVPSQHHVLPATSPRTPFRPMSPSSRRRTAGAARSGTRGKGSPRTRSRKGTPPSVSRLIGVGRAAKGSPRTHSRNAAQPGVVRLVGAVRARNGSPRTRAQNAPVRWRQK